MKCTTTKTCGSRNGVDLADSVLPSNLMGNPFVDIGARRFRAEIDEKLLGHLYSFKKRTTIAKPFSESTEGAAQDLAHVLISIGNSDGRETKE